MVSNKALLTGITGQDSSYLAELLLSKNYEVHGTYRRTSKESFDNIKHIQKEIKLHSMALNNYGSVYSVVNAVKPDETYHLAAQSFVADSFKDEFNTMETNATGTHYMLKACKDIVPHSKFYFAGTSEMYGNQTDPQDELTPMHPVSPYGISKLTGYNLCRYYREAFKMFICCGILFNHESPRRGKEFVTRKICEAAKRKEKVSLGNLEAKRDWGYAVDYVYAMWLMLQQEIPDDYVISTGECHSVGEWAKVAYEYVGLDYRDYVEVDPEFMRLNELRTLRGDSTKALLALAWKPKTTFKELVHIMMREG